MGNDPTPIPNGLDLELIERLRGLGEHQVRLELAKELCLTVASLRRQATLVYILEHDFKADMSDLRSSLFNYIRLIAYGQLDPHVVVRFAGSPFLMRQISALPWPDQERLGQGGKVEVAVRKGDYFDTRMIDPLDLSPDQCRQVFSGGGRIRAIPEQINLLETEPEPDEPSPRRKKSRVEANPRAGTLKVGRTEIPVREVLGSLGDLAPIDHDATGKGGSVTIDADIFGPLKRMAATGDVTVAHLVRMAIMRTYFAGDAAIE